MTTSERTADSGAKGDVKQRLLTAAINLYGDKGTQVSLRAIQREAGVLNEAAIRYYFGSKDKLLDACLESLAEQFIPLARNMIRQTLDPETSSDIGVRDVAMVLVSAFYSLKLNNEAGIRLLARMIREEGAMGQDMLIKHFGEAIWMLEEVIQKMHPEKPAKTIRLHLFLAINNTINGMVDLDLLWRLPSLDDDHEHYHLSEGELAYGFIDYIAAGMAA